MLNSGLPQETVHASPCYVPGGREGAVVHEDRYFGTVLRGIGAPMPLAFEAALFAGEMIFPDTEARDWHGPQNVGKQRKLVEKRLGAVGLAQYDDFLKDKTAVHFLPIAIHKFWWYHDQSFYVDSLLHEQCPYLKFFIPLNEIHEEYRDQAENMGFVGYHGKKKKRRTHRRGPKKISPNRHNDQVHMGDLHHHHIGMKKRGTHEHDLQRRSPIRHTG